MKKGILFVTFALFLLIQCTATVGFKEPTNLSTRSSATRKMKPIKVVSFEQCNYIYGFLPSIQDPMEMYEGVLAEAKKVGGNGVIDYQVRGGKLFYGFFYAKTCSEGVGTAVAW